MGEDSAELAVRVRRLEDLAEIHQLFVDYGRHLDRGDFAAYAALFAEDGEVLLGPDRATGRAEIEAMMTKTLSGRVGETYHLITSPTVELDGDEATATVMWTVVAPADGGEPAVTTLGWHKDRLVRERGHWRFRRRQGYLGLPTPPR
jgi:uncharacterized protein (TIGR02246 family)